MKESIKCASVYIGTVIGAGFATGQEINLYFKNSSPFVVVLSSIILGMLCSLFMYLGKVSKNNINRSNKRIVLSNAIVFICSIISFIAMFSGCEVLIMSIFNIEHIGILVVFIAVIISLYGLSAMKYLNVICVPLIVLLIAIVFLKKQDVTFQTNLNPLNAVAYGGMNIMIAGDVVKRLGKGASLKTIKWSGVISTIVFCILALCIYFTVQGVDGEMPMYIVARNQNIPYVAGFIILLAIFTTMVSSFEACLSTSCKSENNKKYVAILLVILSYPITLLLSFEQIVNYLYPVVGFFGILSMVYAIVSFYIIYLKNKKDI